MSINVTRSSMPPFEEYCNEIKDLWESRWLTNMGAKHKELQAELQKFLEVDHVTLYANGHLALENALESMGFPKDSEVITTPFTFVSTTNAIVRSGLRPVFCDIDPESLTIDPEKIEALITEKTVAIVPVHVYGNICDVEKIQQIADKYGLKVIYDAAHAFGAKYKGRSAASYGDVSMFSFHATKVFNTVEGGCLCYKDDSLVTVLDEHKNFGLRGEDSVSNSGNAKMSEFHAAMGICNLRHLEDEIGKRKAAAERYMERLAGVEGLRVWAPQENVTPNYAYVPVIFDPDLFGATRDDVCAALAQNDIFARKYFYPAVNEMSCCKDFGGDSTPVASKVGRQVLTLPFFADITMETVDKICDIILDCRK